MMNPKKNKKIVAIVALLLAVLMIGSTIMSAIPYVFAASKTELRSQLNSLEQQKKAAQAEVEKLRGQEKNYLKLVYALEDQMELTQTDINTTVEIIDGLEQDITAKLGEIEETQAELDKQTGLFETRVRVMYENGSVSYLDVLLSADSFSDMLNRLAQITQIMDFDKKVIAQVKELKEKLEVQKQELEDDKAAQEEYKASLEDKYAELDDQRGEYQEIADKLNKDQKLKKQQIADMEAEMDSIDAELDRIAKAEAEAARKAAEEAARKAAAAKKNNSSSSSSSYKAYVPKNGELVWPCPGYSRISSPYGWRTHPIYGTQKFHKGVDLAASGGTPVYAAKGGTVVKSYYSSSYGNYIVVSHGGGLMTAYAHLQTRLVNAGDTVSAGQQIGKVGTTGASTGNHLHYEVYVNGSTVNPMNYY